MLTKLLKRGLKNQKGLSFMLVLISVLAVMIVCIYWFTNTLKTMTLDPEPTSSEQQIAVNSQQVQPEMAPITEAPAPAVTQPVIATAAPTEPITVVPTTVTPSVQTVPATSHYILNTSSKKFHRLACRSVDDISPENRQEFDGTRDQIINEYEPCKICKP